MFDEAKQGDHRTKLMEPTHIVGIGASAGGLEALEHLFENMPADTGMAFVVVQHLSPDFKSVMDELLGRKTAIRIHRVEDNMEVGANQIYLIPPKKDMIISNGKLLLTDKDPKQAVNLPIDNFFRSLAQEAGDRAIGIVLSGTGSDGSRGIREIHECSGLVIAQLPESAKFDGMPKSAILTGAVDLVLPPEKIPEALVKYATHGLWKIQDLELQPDTSQGPMSSVFHLLREAYGIDFSHYKIGTVSRRIDRRLLLNHIDNLEDYVRCLRENPAELNSLYKDLLIGVTRFFRDPEAFERLEKEVLPELIKQKADGDEFRIWVAGCATGEEAYSVAILVRDCLVAMKRRLNVKVFATDTHRASVDFASAGLYEEAQLTDINPERLQRCFVVKNGSFHVANEIRQMVVFAHHNLLKDAPFTKLDLITCRNLLIYFQPQIQKRVLAYFHFALNTGGVLFLGPSESPGDFSDEFTIIDPHWKIYRKRRDAKISPDLRMPLSVGAAVPRANERTHTSTGTSAELVEVFSAVLDQVLPPSLVVDERGHLVHTTGDASRYLHFKKGPVSIDILDLVDPVLKTLLSAALVRANLEKSTIVYKGIRIPGENEERMIDLTIRPFVNKRANVYHAVITFEDRGTAPNPKAVVTDSEFGKMTREHIATIEDELRHTKENLQATIEELETSNEELQATNEELVASNEELQSTNEELHSVNEELYSVNAEYQKKIIELTELTEDMDNLLESTHVYTLFLDRNLCIRKFTPQIAAVFNLLPQDIGRRIDHFAHNIECPTLIREIALVRESGQLCEHQVRDSRGHWYLLRILPYKSKTIFEGIVLTLVDVTNLKAAEDKVRQKEIQLSAILSNSPHLVSIKDLDGRYILTDDAFQKIAGCDPLGKTNDELFSPEVASELNRFDQQVLDNGTTVETEVVIPQADGPHTFLTVKSPLRDDSGRIVGVSTIKTDVTHLKRAENRAREAVEQRDRFLAVLSHELRNPLGAIVNAVSVLERDGLDETGRKHAFKVLKRQASQMSRLLDDLLEVSRITQDKFHLVKETVHLDEVIHEAVRVIEPVLEKAKVQLNLDIPNTVPPFEGDSVRLQQMVVNLLTNAAKYTPQGGGVQLTVKIHDDTAVIQVKDQGIGVDPEILPRIFDLFVQAGNSVDRSHGGLGVGLSLVRAIAELHGGSVTAFSEGIGKGCEFTVCLPLPGDHPAETDPCEREAGGSFSSNGVASSKVVIVEDNDDSRQMLESLLKMDVREVYAASNGKDGVEAIETHKPDVAIVDIGLPILNGYEVARHVRKSLGNKVYLVALTGYGQDNDRKAVLQAGFDEHLVKPLRRTDLERLIDRLRSKQTE